MIEKNVQNILSEIEKGNNLGEKITLVGATKFVSVDRINEAIKAGLSDIGENKAQEFRDKFDLVLKPVNYHFFGRLQKNKIKSNPADQNSVLFCELVKEGKLDEAKALLIEATKA